MEQERRLILDLINFAWQNKGVELDRFQIQLFAILQQQQNYMQKKEAKKRKKLE